jgi:hypothetical protein
MNALQTSRDEAYPKKNTIARKSLDRPTGRDD